MNKNWLKYKIENIDALEEDKLNEMKKNEPDRTHLHKPFGFIHNQWMFIKESMEEGDELWFFTSDEHTWQTLCGREGYVIVKNGEPTLRIYTCMS